MKKSSFGLLYSGILFYLRRPVMMEII